MNYHKVTEAAALLLHLCGPMEKLKLMKLLYLADRRFLLEFGVPIFYDNHVSMPNGPALSRTLNLMNDETGPSEMAFWRSMIAGPSGPKHTMSAIQEVEPEHLSPFEVKVITSIQRDHSETGVWELRDLLHTHDHCPEWSDPKGSSKPIRIREILEKWGRDPAQAETVESYVSAMRQMLRQAHA